MNVKELSSKEVKDLLKKICENWGINLDLVKFLEKEFRWYITNKEKKIYILKRDCCGLLKEKIPIEKFGLYIAKMEKDGIRLSIEGTQIFGPLASKNTIDFSAKKFLSGEKPDIVLEGYIIVKDKTYYCGCAKKTSKGILDFVPKHRRIMR